VLPVIVALIIKLLPVEENCIWQYVTSPHRINRYPVEKKPKVYRELQIVCSIFNEFASYLLPSFVVMTGIGATAGIYGTIREFHKDAVTYSLFPIVFIDCIFVSSLMIIFASKVSITTSNYVKSIGTTNCKWLKKSIASCRQFGIKIGPLRSVKPYYLSEFYVMITNSVIPLLMSSKWIHHAFQFS